MRALLGFIFLILAPQIFAGPFDPPPSDESVTILGTIFGSTVGDLFLGGITNPTLYQLMEKLNFTFIAGGALIVSYVTILSVIHTSHEGTMLGKSWSALWIPLRSIVGMSLLVPTPATGYSLIQVAVMWLILQGIGIADLLWNITLGGLQSGVSATTGTAANPSLKAFGEEILPNIMNASLCMQSVISLANSNPKGDSFLYGNGTNMQSFDQITMVPISGGSQPFSFDATALAATVTGTKYYGLNNTNLPQPDASQVCGTISVTATVKLSEYPTGIQNLFTGPNATQSQNQLQNILAQEASLIYYTKIAAYDAMLAIVLPITQGFVSGQYGAPNMQNTPQQTAPAGATDSAGNAYAQYMGSLVVPNMGQFQTLSAGPNSFATLDLAEKTVNNFITNAAILATGAITDFSQSTMTAITNGISAGWISAGSFYFILNETLISTQFASATSPYNSTNYNMPSCGDPNGSCINGVKNYGSGIPDNAAILNANIDAGKDQNFVAQNLMDGYLYIQQDKAPSATLNFGSQDAGVTDLFGNLDSLNQQVLNSLQGIFNGNSTGTIDPLLAHAQFGRTLMLACEGFWLDILFRASLRVAETLIFPGATSGLAVLAMEHIYYSFLALLLPFVGFLYTFGALLAFYCPLIPFMFFTMGALGWFLTVVEAMIAAPIVAIGLVTPGGDDLGRIPTALMILANLFFRPALMIFGFLMAGRVYKAAVQLIDLGMSAIFQTINVSTIFSIVVVVAIYVMFILSVTNVCFALIYALPDKALRWIGGHPEETNIGDLNEIKGAVHETASSIGEAGREVSKKRISNEQERLSKAFTKRIGGGGRKP